MALAKWRLYFGIANHPDWLRNLSISSRWECKSTKTDKVKYSVLKQTGDYSVFKLQDYIKSLSHAEEIPLTHCTLET